MELLLRIVYTANVLVAGWISLTSLFAPRRALETVFENQLAYSESIRLVGALWGGIFLLSIVGLFYPRSMVVVLIFQLIYKSSWLLFVALPAWRAGEPYPHGMAMTFLLWVVVLPFVIPWRTVLTG